MNLNYTHGYIPISPFRTCDLCGAKLKREIVDGTNFWICPNHNEAQAELPSGTNYLGWTRGKGESLTLWNNCPECDSPVCFAPAAESQVCEICLECANCCVCEEAQA